MTQGSFKRQQGGGRPGAASNSKKAKVVKAIRNAKQAKKGAPVQLPKNSYREAAIEDRALSKAIDKSNEQKVAAKLIQGGGKLSTKDILQRGKELNRETRRSQVKKKVSRVEEKLNALKEKAAAEGLI